MGIINEDNGVITISNREKLSEITKRILCEKED